MRIIIDMQGAQTESRYRGIGRYTTSLVEAIVRDNVQHDIVLALTGSLHESVGALRSTSNGFCLPNRSRSGTRRQDFKSRSPDASIAESEPK